VEERPGPTTVRTAGTVEPTTIVSNLCRCGCYVKILEAIRRAAA